MVLSFIPSRPEKELLTIREADEVRRIIDAMEGTHRLLIHGRVNPNQQGDLEGWTSSPRNGACRPGSVTPSGARTAWLLPSR